MNDLSELQQGYLQELADGKLYKNIASDYGVTEQVVKNNMSDLFRKINANGKAHAVAIAFRNGWIK